LLLVIEAFDFRVSVAFAGKTATTGNIGYIAGRPQAYRGR